MPFGAHSSREALNGTRKMTKFKLLSDLHLEFYNQKRHMVKDAPVWEPTPTDQDKDTVLLLAGDIHVGKKALPWIKDRCKQYKKVIYILGNHEFYGQQVHKVKAFWAEVDIDNFVFLDDDVHYAADYRILGGTLWTKVEDPFLVWTARQRMTDYNVITYKNRDGIYRKLNVHATNELHTATVNRFVEILNTPFTGKTIVMTHHLPHPKCVHKKWKTSPLNDFFMTNLDWLINKYDIDVWCHGHTHDVVDTYVGKTRILCNPMGYHGVALNQDFNEDLIFAV